MLRDGETDRKVLAGAVTFDVDTDGFILGVHCRDGGDWVTALIQLVQAGKIRIDLEG